MGNEKMERVTRSNPCPVCGHTDWCLVSPDGTAAICPRTNDGAIKKCGDAGYLHILEDRHDGHDRHRNGARWRHTLTIAHGQDGRTQDFGQLSGHYQSQLTSEKLHVLARSLGLSAGSLQRLRLGWDSSAWTFPMSNDLGRVIGIRRRFPSGGKASVKGSRTGLFIPMGLTGNDPLLLCEGPTDAAAALDLGFDAIGRPNCNSVVNMTIRAAKDRTEIVVVADNDRAGRTGAERLAATLALCCPCVKIIVPPDGTKDLRQWFNAGLTSEALRGIIAATPTIGVKVSLCRTGAAKGVRR
jgi:hypothetical protein